MTTRYSPVRTRNNSSFAAGVLSIVFSIVAIFVVVGVGLYVIAQVSPLLSALG